MAKVNGNEEDKVPGRSVDRLESWIKDSYGSIKTKVGESSWIKSSKDDALQKVGESSWIAKMKSSKDDALQKVGQSSWIAKMKSSKDDALQKVRMPSMLEACLNGTPQDRNAAMKAMLIYGAGSIASCYSLAYLFC